MRPAQQEGRFELFKMSGILVQVPARSPVMAVTGNSPGFTPAQYDCSFRGVMSVIVYVQLTICHIVIQYLHGP